MATASIRHWRRAVAAVFLGVVLQHASFAQRPPVAPKRPVVTDYFGTPVVDDYRYMENLGDPEVKAWMKAQADDTRARLDAIPGRQGLLARVHTLLNADVARGGFMRRGERYFYESFEPGAPLPKLYYRDGLHGQEHLLVDPGALGRGTATHYALDFYQPSWDGKYLAYGVSAGGSEASVLHVLEVATGAVQSEAISRTSESNIAWRPDNRSFYYMRFPEAKPDTPPAESAYNARTYLHVIGAHPDGDADAVVFGRGVSGSVDVPEGQGTYLLLSRTPGSRSRSPTTTWTTTPRPSSSSRRPGSRALARPGESWPTSPTV